MEQITMKNTVQYIWNFFQGFFTAIIEARQLQADAMIKRGGFCDYS
jgi:hypothetical protein